MRWKVPCCVCQTCSSRFSCSLIHCHDKASETDPLTRGPRNGWPCKPCLTILPLLFDPAPVRSLIGVLQPPGFFRVVMEKEASKERIIRKARSLFGPHSIPNHGPVRSIFSQIWRACNPALSSHKDFRSHLICHHMCSLTS